MKKPKDKEAERGRRAFTPEFKREAMTYFVAQRELGVSVSAIARQLGVLPAQLRSWARPRAGKARPGDVIAGMEPALTPEAEIRRLQREVATLRQERDFLKKATAFFAKDSR
jgi:transposase